LKKVLLLAFLISTALLAQPEPVNSEHPVYFFLRKASISGYLKSYDDAILPKSLNEIKSFLTELEALRSKASASFIAELDYYKTIFLPEELKEPLTFGGYFTSQNPRHLYEHKGKNYDLSIDPVLGLKVHGTDLTGSSGSSAAYLRYGGMARFNYKDWFSAYLVAWNGNTYGSRKLNQVDNLVAQKFTFRRTGLEHFDGTEGGLFFEHDIFSASISRNREVWGENFFNKDKISATSQYFDKIKFAIKTDIFTYNYLHGWLVMPQFIVPGNVITGDTKTRTEKYTAQNRIAFDVSNRVRIGLWQSIIYSNRSFELGYLNPFLFWESAQRSLEDLDNSLIGVDVRYLPVAGLELTGSLIFDDINFQYMVPGKFQKFNNRFSFLTGLSYIPSFLENLTVSASYYFVRPYTFAHPGAGEDLAYLNNSFPLGLDVKPNSDMINLRFDWQVEPFLRFSVDYKHIRHGENEYDAAGNLVKNHGGSFFISTNSLSSEDAWFLAGEFQNTNILELSMHYSPGANTVIRAGYTYRKSNFSEPFPENYFFTSLNLFYF